MVWYQCVCYPGENTQVLHTKSPFDSPTTQPFAFPKLFAPLPHVDAAPHGSPSPALLPLHPLNSLPPSLTPSPCVGSLTWPAVHQGAPHSHRLWLPGEYFTANPFFNSCNWRLRWEAKLLGFLLRCASALNPSLSSFVPPIMSFFAGALPPFSLSYVALFTLYTARFRIEIVKFYLYLHTIIFESLCLMWPWPLIIEGHQRSMVAWLSLQFYVYVYITNKNVVTMKQMDGWFSIFLFLTKN